VEDARGAVEMRLAQARAAVDAGRDAAADAREELRRRVDDAKAAYRAGTAPRNGDGAAPPEQVDVVVLEATVEEDDGDLA
jgi:hypothetical protein